MSLSGAAPEPPSPGSRTRAAASAATQPMMIGQRSATTSRAYPRARRPPGASDTPCRYPAGAGVFALSARTRRRRRRRRTRRGSSRRAAGQAGAAQTAAHAESPRRSGWPRRRSSRPARAGCGPRLRWAICVVQLTDEPGVGQRSGTCAAKPVIVLPATRKPTPLAPDQAPARAAVRGASTGRRTRMRRSALVWVWPPIASCARTVTAPAGSVAVTAAPSPDVDPRPAATHRLPLRRCTVTGGALRHERERPHPARSSNCGEHPAQIRETCQYPDPPTTPAGRA